MPRILKIDKFVEDFPSKYGLDADGTCYEVKEDLPIEALLSYKEAGTIIYGKYFEAVWSRFLAKDGDIIMSSKNGTFIKIKDFEGFLECKPSQDTKIGEPQMLKFNSDAIEKIGKNVISGHPMSFENREEISITRTIS